jgi:hypothetical protein
MKILVTASMADRITVTRDSNGVIFLIMMSAFMMRDGGLCFMLIRRRYGAELSTVSITKLSVGNTSWQTG